MLKKIISFFTPPPRTPESSPLFQVLPPALSNLSDAQIIGLLPKELLATHQAETNPIIIRSCDQDTLNSALKRASLHTLIIVFMESDKDDEKSEWILYTFNRDKFREHYDFKNRRFTFLLSVFHEEKAPFSALKIRFLQDTLYILETGVHQSLQGQGINSRLLFNFFQTAAEEIKTRTSKDLAQLQLRYTAISQDMAAFGFPLAGYVPIGKEKEKNPRLPTENDDLSTFTFSKKAKNCVQRAQVMRQTEVSFKTYLEHMCLKQKLDALHRPFLCR